jgi:hypothetical protein
MVLTEVVGFVYSADVVWLSLVVSGYTVTQSHLTPRVQWRQLLSGLLLCDKTDAV